jgi:hypothetical protein
MKKVIVFLTGVLFLFLSTGVNAQTKTGADYFAGKWNVVVMGTPNGDATMIFNLEKKDSTLTGVIVDTTGTEIAEISGCDLKDTALTLYFNASGYDVNLVMSIKDDDHVTGNLMGMFDAEGERIKEIK